MLHKPTPGILVVQVLSELVFESWAFGPKEVDSHGGQELVAGLYHDLQVRDNIHGSYLDGIGDKPDRDNSYS
jgi:hypothetical protein